MSSVDDMKVSHSDGQTLLLDWSRDRIFDKEVTQVFLALLKQHSSVRHVIYCLAKNLKK